MWSTSSLNSLGSFLSSLPHREWGRCAYTRNVATEQASPWPPELRESEDNSNHRWKRRSHVGHALHLFKLTLSLSSANMLLFYFLCIKWSYVRLGYNPFLLQSWLQKSSCYSSESHSCWHAIPFLRLVLGNVFSQTALGNVRWCCFSIFNTNLIISKLCSSYCTIWNIRVLKRCPYRRPLDLQRNPVFWTCYVGMIMNSEMEEAKTTKTQEQEN